MALKWPVLTTRATNAAWAWGSLWLGRPCQSIGYDVRPSSRWSMQFEFVPLSVRVG